MKNQSTLVTILLVLFSTGLFSQRYVNEEWSSINGLPVNIHWSASMIAASGKLITVGNSYTAGQSTNVLLTKRNTDGTIYFQVEYDNPDHLEDYGIALTEDNFGNIYVAATSYRTASASLDLVVLKFNSSGSFQWSYVFNGTGNGDDLPAKIIFDGTNVIVTGGTESNTTASDFITIKLNTSGLVQWTRLYDYNSLDDAAVSVNVNTNGEILVTGGSQDQTNLYDMATIRYSSTGTELNVHRSSYNVGIDKPTSFGLDTNGNCIIGGWYIDGFGQMQLSLISLDDTLGLNWDTHHNPSPAEDQILDMAVSADGKIYVTGHTEPMAGAFECYTAYFSSGGVMLWERKFKGPAGTAFGKRILLDSDGNLNVVGMLYDGTDTNILVLQYDPLGTLMFSKTYDAGGTEIASNVESDHWGNIYVNGTSTTTGSGYVTIKYSTFTRTFSSINDTVNNLEYLDNEIIVQFKPSATNPNPFYDKGKTFGKLGDFISTDAISALSAKFDNSVAWSKLNAVKVFKQMTPDDSLSISRLGDTIRMHHFWTTLVIEVPSNLNERAASDSLNDLDDFVYHSEINLVGSLSDLPDDSEFVGGSQEGLESSNSPENDIEMDRAWDIYKGSNYTRVGVFDSGIDYDHEDFSKTGQLTFSDSKIAGGYDYWHNTPVPSGDGDDNGHGTRTAGIIGAIRNNDLGVASVAGGDGASDNFGADLLDFRIFNENGGFGGAQTSVDKAAEAMVEGARGWNEGGYALDILNNSWAINVSNTLYSEPNKTLMYKTNQSVYDNGAVNVCGRGNEGNTDLVLPANSGPDRFMIAVGGSGIDGAKSTNSSYGGDVDIIAPGVNELVFSTDAYWGSIQDKYHTHNGTSAATPHVAGVAALLTSQANDPTRWVPNRLAPEDVENLMQIYISDVGVPGYEDSTGWGRLNAGEVMEHMQWPNYWVKHFNAPGGEVTSSLVGSGLLVVKEDFDYPGTSHDVAEGYYVGECYEVSFVFPHNIGSAQLLNAWARMGSGVCNLMQNEVNDAYRLYNRPFAVLDSANENYAWMHSYHYVLVSDTNFNPVNKTLPPDTTSYKMAYSLHLYDPEATGTEELDQSDAGGSQFKVWPNPSGESQTLLIPKGENIKVHLVDIKGRVIRQIYAGNNSEEQVVTVDIRDLSPGIYFYRMKSKDVSFTYKIVKI